jgi:hypothetical protein
VDEDNKIHDVPSYVTSKNPAGGGVTRRACPPLRLKALPVTTRYYRSISRLPVSTIEGFRTGDRAQSIPTRAETQVRQDGHWRAVGESGRVPVFCLCLVASVEFLLVAVFGVNDSTDLNYATCHSRHDSQTISFEEALSYTQRSPITHVWAQERIRTAS